jgi:hypothetical protein
MRKALIVFLAALGVIASAGAAQADPAPRNGTCDGPDVGFACGGPTDPKPPTKTEPQWEEYFKLTAPGA